MKIAIVTPGLKFGGAERVLSVLANQWVNLGHEVSFFITVSKGAPAYHLDKDVSVRYYTKPNHGYKILSLIQGIRSFINEKKPDIVLVFMNDQCALTAISLIGKKLPLVYSERNDPNKTNTRFIDRVYRKIVEARANSFVFQTTGAQRCYKKSVQAKSKVILNPLDTKQFPVHDFSSENNEIVSVGRLEPQKNFPLLIDAFSKISDEFPKYKLVIYGDGSLRNELTNLVVSLHLQEKILFMGEVKDIRPHMKDAQAFVLSSDFEGLPNALMEAMAMGLPCISTDCSPGGARMLIEDTLSGHIVPCGDALALSEALRSVLTDRQHAKNLGENAIKIREKTDSTKIAKQWLELFDELNKRR